MKRFAFVLALLLALFPWAGAPAEQGMPAPAAPEPMPAIQYVGIAQDNVTLRADMSRDAASLGYYRKGDRVQIIGCELQWLKVVKGDESGFVTGYVLRHMVGEVVTRNADLPYGATPSAYSAVLSRDTLLHTEPDGKSDVFLTMTKGTKVAILEINNGWAKVIHWRSYGYFYLDSIEQLTPVYDAESAASGDTLAAFISFYDLSEVGLNPNRIVNILKACEYISVSVAPGEKFSFNRVAGPYQYKRGYLDGMSFFEGRAVPSVGGGVCQVSSTMYNALIALPRGIKVTAWRTHGPSGATYLPHGVDAAVGSETLDLSFVNLLDFPVRIEASAQDGVLYIALIKA